MPVPKLSKLDLRIMEALWSRGPLCVRDIQESFPEGERPAYTTVQTIVNRLVVKNAIRHTRKISNAFIFEAAVSRRAAQRRLIDDFLGLFNGQSEPIVLHLIECGKLTVEDVQEAEQALQRLARKGKSR